MENKNLEEGRGKKGQMRQASRTQDDEWGGSSRIKKSFKTFRDNARKRKEAQYEEVEQIDELSKGTLKSYVKKAHAQQGDNFEASKKSAEGATKYYNRKNSAKLAAYKLDKDSNQAKVKANEEVEQIDELSGGKLADYATKATDEFHKKSAEGDYKGAQKRFKGVHQAKKKFGAKMNAKYGLKKEDYVDALTEEGLEAIEIGINEYFLALGEEVDQETFNAILEDVAQNLVEDLMEVEESGSILEFNNKDNKKTKADIIESVVDKYAPEIEYEELTEEEHIIDVLSKFVGNKAIQEVLDLYDNLDEENKDELLDLLDSKEGINEVLNFVIENRTEDE